MQGFNPETWSKRGFNKGFFPINIAKFLRTPVFKNICERLFEHFPIWENNITSNIGIEEDIFSKTKQKNTQNLVRWKNFCLFITLDHFIFLSISTVCLRQRLPYIIKDESSTGLWNSLINERIILDQRKITPLCCYCPFSTLLGFSARKCGIAICIVIANTILVTQRRI